MKRATYVVATIAWVLLGAANGAAQSQAPFTSGLQKAKTRVAEISQQELEQLRPIAEPDVAKSRLNQSDRAPSKEQADALFREARFWGLDLGRLGRAVVVADVRMGTANHAWVAVYANQNGRWRKLIETAGFGPEVYSHEQTGVPDLIFGWGAGAFDTKLWRYRYRNGTYVQDACDHLPYYDAAPDRCKAQGKQGRSHDEPTFPNPYREWEKSAGESSARPKMMISEGRTGAEILGESSAKR